MTEKTLPPIATLFKESWNVFINNFLNLLWLFLLSVTAYVILALIVIVMFFIFGISSILMNPEAGLLNLMTNPVTLIPFILTIIIGLVLFIITGMIFQIATIKLVHQSEKKQPLIALLKSSAPFIWPVFTVSFLSGLLALGGLTLFVIPGILFSILFSFSTYEVLFNNQKGLNALRRSFALFSTNFWGILGRLVLYFVISAIITFAISRNSEMGIFSAIVNIILSWFSICYSITLYKQVAKGHEHLPGKSLKWIVITSIIGLVLITLLAKSLSSLYMNTLLPIMMKNQNLNQLQTTNPNQNYEIPTEQQMEEMLKQLPEGESMQFEDQAI